ncbi:MAG: DUF1573 domain-containing protein [Verrucomicrobiae bacterium]|nr:DUF1573 domain-containing protein [Verrucomicrobiae bacterium]
MSQAQIKWESPVLELRPTVQDRGMIAEYHFRNEGKRPVTINAIKSNCKCVTVLVDKKTYQPGEKGTLTAQFEFGRRLGRQEHQIAVSTDDAQNPVSVLQLRAFIPSPLTIDPPSLFWSVGEAATAKTIRLKAETAAPIQITKVSSDGARFVPKLQTRVEGKEYTVVVTPTGTAKPVREIIRMETSDPGGRPRVYSVETIVGKSTLPAGLSEQFPAKPR